MVPLSHHSGLLSKDIAHVNILLVYACLTKQHGQIAPKSSCIGPTLCNNIVGSWRDDLFLQPLPDQVTCALLLPTEAEFAQLCINGSGKEDCFGALFFIPTSLVRDLMQTLICCVLPGLATCNPLKLNWPNSLYRHLLEGGGIALCPSRSSRPPR